VRVVLPSGDGGDDAAVKGRPTNDDNVTAAVGTFCHANMTAPCQLTRFNPGLILTKVVATGPK